MSHDDVDHGEMPDELDAFFDDLRSAAADTPAPLPGAALATLFRDGIAPVVVPLRRRWAVRVVVAGAVGGLAFGGLGVAGALPRPVQARVADVVDHVGVHLPDARPATTTTVPPASTTTSTTTAPHGAAPTPRRAITTTTTVDDHGSGRGGDGSVDHTSGTDNGGTDNGGTDNGGTVNGGTDKGSGDSGGRGKQQSGRNPDDGGDVHLHDGSAHASHDNEGRTE